MRFLIEYTLKKTVTKTIWAIKKEKKKRLKSIWAVFPSYYCWFSSWASTKVNDIKNFKPIHTAFHLSLSLQSGLFLFFSLLSLSLSVCLKFYSKFSLYNTKVFKFWVQLSLFLGSFNQDPYFYNRKRIEKHHKVCSRKKMGYLEKCCFGRTHALLVFFLFIVF